jgi:hypothetical protein
MANAGWLSRTHEDAYTYQSAECLYLILANIQDGDTNGLEFFRDTEIGDKDGDGMNEILDGWGNPIKFLRWAPGFESEKQGISNSVWLQNNPDPFDPLGSDVKLGNNSVTYYLYPLVWSNGSDGESKIRTDGASGRIDYGTDPNPFQWCTGDRSAMTVDVQNAPGSPVLDENSGQPERGMLDNVHNHIVRARVR